MIAPTLTKNPLCNVLNTACSSSDRMGIFHIVSVNSSKVILHLRPDPGRTVYAMQKQTLHFSLPFQIPTLHDK